MLSDWTISPQERTFAVLFAVWGWVPSLITSVIFIINILLILIVLIQRGTGGGFAGAFGGAGGSSAFGSRRRSFTKITIGLGAVWIVLTMLDVVLVQRLRDAITKLDVQSGIEPVIGERQ